MVNVKRANEDGLAEDELTSERDATPLSASGLVDRRPQILRSAYKYMGEKGVMRFSLQDVADDLGVSKALLLYHFKHKEALVVVSLQWALESVAMRIQRAISDIPTAEGKVEAMLDAILQRPEQNRHFYKVYADLLSQATRSDAYSSVATTFHTTVNGMYAEVAQLGMREGVFSRRDPQAAAEVMRALIDGLFFQWLLERDWQTTHAAYRVRCKRDVLAYLRSA
jgi:AcrR family transcriptional regulator